MLATTAKIARDPSSGQSKGYGFVSYTDFESADGAIEAMNGQFLMNKAITVQYAFKKDGKGERHGTSAERLLAAQARKNNALPITARPPPATLNALAAFGPSTPSGPAVTTTPIPPPGMSYQGPYQGQFAGALAAGPPPSSMGQPPPPPGFGGPPPMGMGMPGMPPPGFGGMPPPPPGFGPPPGYGGVPPAMGMPPPAFGGPPIGMPPPPGFGIPQQR